MLNARFLLSILLILSISIARPQSKGRRFTWGINGHPLTQVAYSHNTDKQISDLKDLNITSYRFDVLLNSEGYAKKDQQFIQLLNKLNQNGITALPVLMQSGLKDLDNNSVYNLGYIQGQNFMARYGKYISVMEVNNEADLKIMLPGNFSGSKPEHYNLQKSSKVIAAIKGFIDGAKKNSPRLQVTLSVSYTHYYYLQLLKDSQVNYDIIGCHWYSNMGPIDNARPKGENALEIFSRFNKPIWVTEINYSKGTLKADFSTQNAYLKNAIPGMISEGITGFFIYELYDQPALSNRNAAEAHYGLIYQDSNATYQKKDAYNGYKQLVNINQ